MGDDTISIYEPAVKNSGIIEGPFLRRNKYKNVEKHNEFITPTDMPIGGNIKINGYSYKILSCDEYTVKYLQSHMDWWERTALNQTTIDKVWSVVKLIKEMNKIERNFVISINI